MRTGSPAACSRSPTIHAPRDKVLPRVPMRHCGKPGDFGAIAVYLLSVTSSYGTGATFLSDGV